jgi:hypothetical protein
VIFEMKKYVQRMWRIHDVLFLDKEKAEKVEDGKEIVKEVFVGIDENTDYDLNGESVEFFGSWIFTDKKEVQKEVDEFNND